MNEFLAAPLEPDNDEWTLLNEVQQIERAGFQVLRYEEAFLDSIFHDIGAVVFFLRIIAWQIPDFKVETYRDRLLKMHRHIEKHGAFYAKSHRYVIEAQKG